MKYKSEPFADINKMILGLLKNTYNITINKAGISIVTYAIFFLLIAVYQNFDYSLFQNLTKIGEFIYGQTILIVTLLTWPITFATNTIWSIPVILIIFFSCQKKSLQ